MGIKVVEADILRKAKQDRKKIEEYKLKLRNSAVGGVITNNLSTILDKFKNNQMAIQHAKSED